ncbi:hypothetical protein HOB94_06670 [bacterium]|nr:hypothetical protein [bacterium]
MIFSNSFLICSISQSTKASSKYISIKSFFSCLSNNFCLIYNLLFHLFL